MNSYFTKINSICKIKSVNRDDAFDVFVTSTVGLKQTCLPVFLQNVLIVKMIYAVLAVTDRFDTGMSIECQIVSYNIEHFYLCDNVEKGRN